MTGGRLSTWLHRLLLRCYPAEFREEYGREMARDFGREISRARPAALPGLWARVLADWLVAMPREQWDVTRHDLRDAFRSLRRSPVFTLLVATSLAVGIAANCVVFTFANSLLLQTPLGDPSRFVGVLRGDGSAEPASWLDYVDYRDRNRTFSQLAAWNVVPLGFGRGRGSASVMAETVTGNYFDLLRVKPLLGRLFASGECRSGCAEEVILSHRLWRTEYGSDPFIVGRQVPLSGVPATIVGVAPEGFDGTLAPVMTDIWVHLENRRSATPSLFSDRRTRSLAIAGRLKDGVPPSQAVADLNAIDHQLQREHRYPDNEDRRLWAAGTRGIGIPHIRRRVEMVVGLLGTLAGLVLVISCANVTNIVLARAAARRPETALRRALGAGTARLVRASMTESLVLASIGGAAGLIASMWVTDALPRLQPPANDLYTYRVALHQDVRVWAFTVAITLVAGVVCGLLPAAQAVRANCMAAIRNLDDEGRPRLLVRKGLVSCQVAFSVVLLVAAGLFLRSFERQRHIAPGFPVANRMIVPLNLNLASYAGNEEKGRRFYRTVKDKVQQLPGVRSTTLASSPPLNVVPPSSEVWRDAGTRLRATMNLIDPDYLAIMNVPIVGGRNFTDHDGPGSPAVALVDERLARVVWPGAKSPLDALGRTLLVGAERRPAQVVGVVRSEVRSSLTESPRPLIPLPVAQRYSAMLYLLVETARPPEQLSGPIRRVVESEDDTVSLRRMRTFEAQLGDVLWPIRTGSRVVFGVGAVALLLAVAGLYGVIRYSMARRRREIGIRMALGARQADVLRLVVRQGLAMTLWGIVIGLPLALAVNVALARTLYGLRPVDPLIAAGAITAWLAVTCVACTAPARRAVRDAARAIRDLGSET